MVQKMTKQKMILALTEVQIENMDQSEILDLASQMMAQNLAKLSRDEIQDQYEYAFGITE